MRSLAQYWEKTEGMGMCLNCIKYNRSQRKIPLDFTNGCVKLLGEKGIKLQASLLAAVFNGKGREELRSHDTERWNEKAGRWGSLPQKRSALEDKVPQLTGQVLKQCTAPDLRMLDSWIQTEEDER